MDSFEKYNEILEKLEPIKVLSPSDYFAIYNKVIDLYMFNHFETSESKLINNIINNISIKNCQIKCNCDYYNKKYSCINLFDLPKCKHIESIKNTFPMLKILFEKGYGHMRLPKKLQVLTNNTEITECIQFITDFCHYHHKINKIEIIALLSCIIFIVSNFSKSIRNQPEFLKSTLDLIDNFFKIHDSIPETTNSIIKEFFSHSKEESIEIIKSWRSMISKWYKIQ